VSYDSLPADYLKMSALGVVDSLGSTGFELRRNHHYLAKFVALPTFVHLQSPVITIVAVTRRIDPFWSSGRPMALQTLMQSLLTMRRP
jgi:hypothetical protein